MMATKYGMMVLASVAAMGLALSVTAAEAKGGGNKVRERCKAFAANIGKMDARWEVKKVGSAKERKRFRVQFEAATTSTLVTGAILDVYVSTVDANQLPVWVQVGSMTLKDGGDDDSQIEGKLRFDSKPHSSPTHPWQPFPANWPTDVADGTDVELREGATALVGCELH